MKISFVIALLLSTSSSTRLVRTESSTTAAYPSLLVQKSREGSKSTKSALAQVGQPQANPVVQAVTNAGLNGLKDLLPQLQREKRTIQYAINSFNRMEQGAMGVEAKDQYDPKFIADLVAEEFSGLVEMLAANPNQVAWGVQGVLRQTPLRQLGLAQTEQNRTPLSWCKSIDPSTPRGNFVKDTAACQLTEMMPNPSDMLNEWSRAIGGLTGEIERNGEEITQYLARDISAFNSMLTGEALRLGVPLPENGLPDPQAVAGRIVNYAKMLNNGTKANYEQILEQLENVELSIASFGANTYKYVAGFANQQNSGSNQATVPTDALPGGEKEAIALASGLLKAIEKANSSGSLNGVFSTIQQIAKSEGLDLPPPQQAQAMLSGAVNQGIDALKQPANQDYLYQEGQELDKQVDQYAAEAEKDIQATLVANNV